MIFKNGSHKALDLRGRSRNMRYHQLRVNQPRNAATLQQWVGQQTSSIPSNHLCAMQYLKFDGDFYARMCRKHAASQDCAADFVRARAVEMHMNILGENLQEKCGKTDGGRQCNRGLSTYRKNPSVWTCCLGETCVEM